VVVIYDVLENGGLKSSDLRFVLFIRIYMQTHNIDCTLETITTTYDIQQPFKTT
jgi:hypothetical protein